ncbi:response regulator [Desulfobulbus rhabdoformis]|uniref:ATP-binding protein n=1 Tax=Desulfobulbus rhabdoformis TaxID=34032 RepID=UPI001963CA25|nr:response regulator [Desulfobulbus rhabdoformis]
MTSLLRFLGTPPSLQPRSVQRRLVVIALATFGAVLTITYGGDQLNIFFNRVQQKSISTKLSYELNTFIIDRFKHAVHSLTEYGEVIDACGTTTKPDNSQLQRVLNTAQGALDVAYIYIMNTDGLVIGCSTGTRGSSLTGEQYRFRPYFTQALAGDACFYPAVGVTTNKKGFYFSAPVYGGGREQPIGVLVVKTRSEFIDTFFTGPKDSVEALLVSQEGAIFASTLHEWNFKRSWPIDQQQYQALLHSRQFGDNALDPLPVSLRSNLIFYNNIRYCVYSHPLTSDGWTITTLMPVPFPWAVILLFNSAALSIGVLCGLLVIHAHNEEELTDQVRAGQHASWQAERLRRNSMLELESIFSASLVGIVLVRDGGIVNVNNRMTEIFGFSRKEILENDIRQFFASRGSFRQFVTLHLPRLTQGTVEQVEYTLRKKDGSLIPCTLSGKAINSDDLSHGTVWVIEDISRRKSVEQELKRAREAAEAANIAKGEFLANMSHEIRTPMNGIIGLSNILLREPLGHQQREQLSLINRSALRLMTIINDILDFSKLEAGRYDLEVQPLSLKHLLQEVLGPLEVTARRKNIILESQIAPEVPCSVFADQTKLMQVLTNLVDNSLKFTKHGKVGVYVRTCTVSVEGKEGVLFEVADTGLGIAPEYQEKVFESFTQADTSHSRNFGGTGLGLSITKGLVELMEGTIWFESQLNKGTRFFFCVPLQRDTRLVPDGPTPLESFSGPLEYSAHGEGQRILVAEDEYINKILIRTLLQQAGYHVTVVTNGKEAVEAWRGGIFDCILMDIQMPEMDGYEAVDRIRQSEPPGEHIPIIAMTAHALRSNRKKCLDAGMDEYVSKPIDGQAVLNLLRDYLQKTEKSSDSLNTQT